ncbi:MAG TPA: glycosyltransferase family 9 protein, partial [Candidatus Saccharimonadales bacterium]|nr:glycosyltransferase family 9 protein [Candidatus Saccharimonadales bacterium]
AFRPQSPEYSLRVPAGGGASVRARLHDLGITGDYVVVGPGGSWRAKCWPAERYGEFCRELERKFEMRVVVIHGPGEKEIADIVVRAAAPAGVTLISTTIEELMGLLAHARCLVAADSGPLHLAAALGTPVVGLYGPTDPARNGPFVSNAAIVHKARPEEISYKRRTEYSAAMLRINVGDVMAATESLLKVPA